MVYNIVNVRQIKTKENKLLSLVDICCSDEYGSCIVTRYLSNELYDTYKGYLSVGSTRIDEEDVTITIRNNDLYVNFKL